MSPHHIPHRCAACRAALRSLALVVIVTAAFAPSLAAASPSAIATAPDRANAAPPHFADTAHVFNGCHVSTLAFLTRFAAEFPAERGKPLVVSMRNADGSTRPHTLAVVTWRGDLWCRDEYFGVFPLNCRAASEPKLRHLIARVEPLLEKHARLHLKRPGAVGPTSAPKNLSAAESLALVRTAASLLPLTTRLFWINDGTAETPALLFRPSPEEIAVYLPTHGTCVAECNISDDALVVEIVAGRLGYRDARVRAEPALPSTSILALATSP